MLHPGLQHYLSLGATVVKCLPTISKIIKRNPHYSIQQILSGTIQLQDKQHTKLLNFYVIKIKVLLS